MFQAPQGEEMSQASRGREVSQARRGREGSQARRADEGEEIDVKPKLNLLISHEGQEITVRVKANMPFRKIFDAASQRFGKEPGTLRFAYDGNRIQPDDTPAGLEMEDNDMVDALLEQLGGDSLSIPTSF